VCTFFCKFSMSTDWILIGMSTFLRAVPNPLKVDTYLKVG
jgi:hypothetical protein